MRQGGASAPATPQPVKYRAHAENRHKKAGFAAFEAKSIRPAEHY
jgi:hypothetical protein